MEIVMIKNVVLDIGGVLVDFHTTDYYTNRGYSLETAKSLRAVTMDSPYWEHNDIGIMPYDWILEKMKSLSPSLAPAIEESLSVQKGIVTHRKESKDWIETLRGMGFRVLVLSNFSESALRDCPEAMDFLGENLGGRGKIGDYGVITEGIISCKVHMIKPYPSIYATLLTRYGLLPQETVFVDDTQKNLTAAEVFGIRTVFFESRQQVTEKLQAMQQE